MQLYLMVLTALEMSLQDRDGKVPGDLAVLAGETLLDLYAAEAPSKTGLVAALLKAQQIPVSQKESSTLH